MASAAKLVAAEVRFMWAAAAKELQAKKDATGINDLMLLFTATMPSITGTSFSRCCALAMEMFAHVSLR